ncbi:hypothetical protein [Fredinandcohnia quinoae]|uniref:Uncharacterized protein n=1 Tax=Fredinandcohnia quinoae TaxID=2918902 RepID=A0AAW5E4R4_9BACI|nr:hypothetical protein [Fredinandcohnia sp. SECRCQ15]MCH1627932.1 hypothetical protein [Fredinandcohnia sp. SECRCQ15]
MKNSLLMRTEATYTLNFLIFIQNIYYNQNCSEEKYKFPYFPSKLAFKEEFEVNFKDLWNEAFNRISQPNNQDMEIFCEEREFFYEQLFMKNAESLKDYSDIHKSFQVWWGSLAGQFSVERSIDEQGEKLYVELANALMQKGIEPQMTLNISLVYDACLYANTDVTSYFAVLSIQEMLVKYKTVVPWILGCIN